MWLETRGGQVCIAKNEKTKDEQYINLSSYDVYRVTGPDGPPHGTGFVLRRSTSSASSSSTMLTLQMTLLETFAV